MSPSDVPSLRVLGLGGEKIPQAIIDRWSRCVKLIMCYGSTETNLCILETIDQGRSRGGTPIGVRAWIVDPGDFNRLAPIGAVGELVIEGWCLARGYLNGREQTLQKFPTSSDWIQSLGSDRTARLCRVGDLAQYTSEGTIHIGGRGDAAAKIRGQRFEPGEVENRIRQALPRKMQAVVEVTTLQGDSDPKIIAFVALEQSSANGSSQSGLLAEAGRELKHFISILPQIRNELSKSLPPYMLPSVFIPLLDLPLLSTGKLDRRKLQWLASTLTAAKIARLVSSDIRDKRPPKNPTETELCNLWSEVLNVATSDIGLDDDFIGLGGDSVSAINLVSAAREKGIEMTVDIVFKHPKLYELASACSMLRRDNSPKLDSITLHPEMALLQEISDQYSISPSAIQDIYPATNLQAGLIALSMKQPGAYAVRSHLPLPREINVGAFQSAWQAVVQLQPILRTRLVQTTSGVMQVVMSEAIDWAVEDNFHAYVARDKQRVIGLGDGLTRYAIIESFSDRRRFVWTAHHALFDAWSMTQTFRLVEAAYKGARLEPAANYKLFIMYLSTVDHEAQDSYWRSQLVDASPLKYPALPTATHQPLTNTALKQAIVFSRHPASVFTVATMIRTAWALLLSQYANTDDVIFGATVSGRASPVERIDQIIGPTIATVPIRIRWNRDQPLASLLQDVQSQAAGMIPFEQIGMQNVKRLSSEIQHACNFQTLLVIQTSSSENALRFAGGAAKVEDWQNLSAYALVMEAMLTEHGAFCHVTYDSQVMCRDEVVSLVFQLEHIVQQLCLEEPNLAVKGVSAFSQHDEVRLRQFNGNMPETIDSCAHREYFKQVSVHPDALAIDSWDGRLTYHELEDEARTLAHYLAKISTVGVEDVVPVVFPKSKFPVISMLAVWKLGGAFALIDAGHPTSWIQKIVQGTRAKLVLCSSAIAESLSRYARCLTVDADLLEEIATDHTAIDSTVNSQNLAYVVHTSGSTGKPKGIMHTHSTYVSGVKNRIPTMYRDRTARVLQFASYSFDVSIEDVWTTLLVGGVVCIPSDHERSNDLVGYMNRAQTTYAEITPSLARTLQPESLPYMKIVALSGEASTKADRDRWLNNVIVLDEYGPAEIAIKSNLKHVEFCSHASDKGPNVACLGWITEVANHDRLQAIGAIGELLLEGPIVARGYLREPEKTAEVFIQNPAWLPAEKFGHRRLYKTGDLAGYNPDFSLRILGRKDTQVKLRGQRLELGQIEHQVRQSLAIPCSVVADLVFLNNGSKNGNLVVFVSFDHARPAALNDEFRSRARELHSQLSVTLPSFMVPSAIIPMASLPLNMSGKVDRLKLKQAASGLDAQSVLYFSEIEKPAARSSAFTEPEKRLRSLWAEILEMDIAGISLDDNFLHIGGDSILAMKMVAVANKKGNGIILTVKDIFRHPRLCDMALVASAAVKGTNSSQIEPYQLLDCAGYQDADIVRRKVAALCRVKLTSIRDVYPCSPLQEGLTAISVKRPGYYIAQHVFDIPASVELDRLTRAWAVVVDRTPTLLTRIVQLDSKLVQVVVDHEIEWREGRDLEEWITEDKASPMLPGDPLVRFAIIEGCGKRHLVFSLHHAIYDGWSFNLLLEAVTRTYHSDTSWKPPTEYKHFIRYVLSLNRESHLRFWQAQLAGVADYSANFPRLPETGYECKAGSTLEQKMRVSIGKRRGFTIPTVLQAAWALLLTKYTQSMDIVFGTTINGRNIPLDGIDEMIGPIFTTVPVRMKLDMRSAIPRFISEVQNRAVENIEYQHFGLQAISQINEDTKAACQFRTLIVMQTTEQGLSPQGGLMQRKTQNDFSKFNPFAIMVQFIPTDTAEILVNVNFDSDVIDEIQMQRLLFQLEFVVERLCHSENNVTIGDVPLLDPHDRQEINKWNSEKWPESTLSCVHRIIQQRVCETPAATAVHSWDGTLSYCALDQMSTRLASYLATFGLRPDEVVPVCFDKSVWAVVATLGALKAGAAFTLLDPSHPVDRLSTIIRETNAKIILASASRKHLFHGKAEITIVVNEAALQTLPVHERYPDAGTDPVNLACVVFTSGSTGKPKGILLEHRNLCSSIIAHGSALNVGKDSRVFQFASFAFDMAVYDILTTLSFGGCVCIPSDHDKMNNLASAIESMQANWAFFTPTTVALLNPKDVPSLKTLIVGGEPVTKDICEEWIDKVRLFQCSGPAETTTCVAGEMDRSSKKNCLGRCCGATSWIVDPTNHHVLQPIGVIGELVLEGPTVARGYLNKCDEASGGFIVDPQWSQSWVRADRPKPRRMYKTGDLVQYDSLGRLLFIGRQDTQVKMRGQRLELSEVEGCLRRVLPDARVAAEIITPSDGYERLILAAFLALKHVPGLQRDHQGLLAVGESNAYAAILEEIRKKLSKSLPPYMVPSVIVPLDHIPLNLSGKIDRPTLRNMGSTLTSKQLSFLLTARQQNRAPRTATEHCIRDLWAEVFGVTSAEICIDDNFLHMGGDSLSAMRLVAIARRENIILTVSSVFKNPTLVDMAAEARNYGQEPRPCKPFELLGDKKTAAAIRHEVVGHLGLRLEEVVDIYPCTPLQEGLLALSMQRPGAYMAQEVYKLPHDVDLARFKNACEAVAVRNPILRTRILQLKSSKLMQVVLDERIDWATGTDVDDYLQKTGKQPVELKDPLTKWAIIGSKSPSLVVNRHHCSYDGHSLPLMMKQVEQAYQADCFREDIEKSSVGYNNFIRYLMNGNEKDHVKYWHDYLSGASQTHFLRLANDDRLFNPSLSISHLIDVTRTPKSTITLPTVIRAAWGFLLAQYSSSTDIVFGMTLSGRNAPINGIEEMCGPTFTTVPIRVNFERGTTDVLQHLTRVQGQAIEMIPHEHYGLQSIRRISPEIRKACEFESLLVIQPNSDSDLNGSICRAQHIEGSSTFRTYAFTMVCRLVPDGIITTANFDPEAVDEMQVRRLLLQFERVVQQMAHNVSLQLSTLSMMTDADETEIWKWNAVVPKASESCVHEIIERQMRFRPSAPAVDSWDGTLSYAELDRLSSKLADHLIGLGVGADAKVAILFEKSMWTVVAILSVLRAGGAFVPLDPTHPTDRLKALIDQAKADLALTSLGYQKLGAEVVRKSFTVSPSSINKISSTGAWVSVNLAPGALAYVNFTSGSTGAPKASMIEHSAYCSGAAGHIPKIAINEFSRVLQFASYSFDTCIEDMLTTLMAGGCICIPSETQRESDIIGFINSFRVNWAHLTPSFASSIPCQSVPGLKVLLLGGEAMTSQHVQAWSPRVKLINVFGPSELCVTCSVNPNVAASREASNIGYTVGSVSWVADPQNHDRLAPIGTVGELLVEGPLMARGYMDDDEKTAKAFIESPTWLRRGSHCVPGRHNRLYKTGDLVRYDSDGSLVFVGRKDSQVKLRGQRIELGEIEHNIRTCFVEKDLDVVVEMLAPEAVSAVSTLVAFIVMRKGDVMPVTLIDEPPSSEFRAIVQKLRERLLLAVPLYMIPSFFIPINYIPLTGSKKSDRRKLSSVASSLPAEVIGCYGFGKGQGRLPETKLEKQMQTIWSQVLNKPLDLIWVNSTFLLIGGDSISAMQVLARCKKAGINVTLREILQHPTIEGICACIMGKGHSSENKDQKPRKTDVNGNIGINGEIGTNSNASTSGLEVNGQRHDRTVNGIDGADESLGARRPFPLSPIQRRFFQLYPKGNMAYQLSYYLELQAPKGQPELLSAIHSIVQTHDMLRARFCLRENGRWEQSVTDDVFGSFRFRSCKRENLVGLKAIATNSQKLIDIERGPCLVVNLITTPQTQVLFLSAHHLVSDLVSWRIILEDLEELLRNHNHHSLMPSTSYPSWCFSQQKSARKTLDPASTLPFTLRTSHLSFWGLHLSRKNYKTSKLRLDDTVSQALTGAGLIQAKPIDLFLAALIHSFARTFPERDTPVIFNSSHGRQPVGDNDYSDLSRTVGWLTSFYPVQVDVQQADNVAATIRQLAGLHRQVLENDSSAYFTWRYLSDDNNDVEITEIAFNYQGRYQQLDAGKGMFRRLALDEENCEEEGEVNHASVLEVVMGWRDDGSALEARFSFHPDIAHRERVEEWIKRFGQILGEAVANETNLSGC
ncbi:MAG: hypothetical protein LQ342_007852 [Letrouitia transgressa]|nr:MAG: hypothetical protein LQ342_007852 [Letrouitia transgressa]